MSADNVQAPQGAGEIARGIAASACDLHHQWFDAWIEAARDRDATNFQRAEHMLESCVDAMRTMERFYGEANGWRLKRDPFGRYGIESIPDDESIPF